MQDEPAPVFASLLNTIWNDEPKGRANMTRNYWIAISTCLLFGWGSVTFAADYNFKPGLWETTTTMEMKGMPGGMSGIPGMGPRTERHCIRNSDTEFIPKTGKSMDRCKVKHKRVSRNKLRWSVTCDNDGMISRGKGEVVYSNNSSSGHFEMTINSGRAGPMVMKSTFKSRRVGACK